MKQEEPGGVIAGLLMIIGHRKWPRDTSKI